MSNYQMVLPGETLQSALPMDIPWWLPDHSIFFGSVYLVLGVIGLTLAIIVLKTLRETKRECCSGAGH